MNNIVQLDFVNNTWTFNMTFVKLSKRKTDRVGLEPVFDFQWHPLKNKTHIISDFIPTWDVQFGKIKKLTVEQSWNKLRRIFLF